MSPSDLAYLEEFARDSADLMRRALAYAAQKRAEEHAKIMGTEVLEPNFNGRAHRRNKRKANRRHDDAASTPARVGRSNNGRKATVYDYDGKTMSLSEWATELGINPSTLNHRIWSGIPFAEAIKPKLPRGRRPVEVDHDAGGGSQLPRVDA